MTTRHYHTDAAHAEAELVVRNNLDRHDVPAHLHGGLCRYLLLGIRPGHFLMAVLTNDLADAVNRADAESRENLWRIVRFLANDTPRTAWGSPARVEQWIAACVAERKNAATASTNDTASR